MQRDLRTNALVVITVLLGAPAQTRAQGAASQQMLDFFAKPALAADKMPLLNAFPSHFVDWTEAQRKSGLQLVTQRCALINALEHDNPKARLVPKPVTTFEDAELAVSVCLPAQMPGDWPERPKYLENAQRLITKAKSHGAALHLPPNLVQR